MNDPAQFFVDPTARLGVPMRPLQGFVKSSWLPSGNRPSLPKELYIGAFSIIGEHVVLGERVVVEEHCKIGRGVRIGDDTLVVYASRIGANAKIGSGCVIGGVVCEDCEVGCNCRVFGKIIHRHPDPTCSWDHSAPEPAARVLDWTFVGCEAIVVGGITIGPRAYVCAGAIVTKDVPEKHIAFGNNRILPHDEWRGALRNSALFR